MPYIVLFVVVVFLCSILFATYKHKMRLGKRMGWSRAKTIAYYFGFVKLD